MMRGETLQSKPWLPYVAPFGLYMFFLQVQGSWPQGLVWLYPIKTISVAAVLWYFRRSYVELLPAAWARPSYNPMLGVATGLLAILIWVAINPFYPHLSDIMGMKMAPFDPTALEPVTRWTFITFRIIGAVIVVPVMEELFWRGFAIRWIDDEHFQRVPVGVFSWKAFGVTVLLFGLEHNEWLAGLICGALYNVLLYKRRELFSCVVAHAVSNAALAAWVLATGDWKLW